jgi:SIR2-like domain
MAASTIQPFDWDTIIASIRGGICVPFLGAGVNASANGYRGLPLGGQVARRLLGKLIDDETSDIHDLVKIQSQPALADHRDLLRVSAQDLARVALHIQVKGGNPRLLDLLDEILDDPDCHPSRLLTVLARLPVRLIVTTNYDHLMERAFALKEQPAPLVLIQPIDGFTRAQQAKWTKTLSELGTARVRPRCPQEPAVLYKIHGSLNDGSGELIVTEQDYIDFLTVAGTGSRGGVPPLISAMIQDSSLLFLGYGLEDWDFRTIYKALVETLPKRAQRMSFAIQKDPSPFWEEVWREKKVKIYNVDLYEFADELIQRMGEV